VFEEVLAREFSDYRYGKIHRLTRHEGLSSQMNLVKSGGEGG
jgi:hypothetical protein